MKKNNQNNNNGKEDGCGSGSGGGGGKKQKASSVTVVVLKMDLHCEGCAGRVVKAVRALDGVECVRIGDTEYNKLTVIGRLDPGELRQKVEEKTKKKVEVISDDKDNKKKQQKTTQQDEHPHSDKPKTAVKKDEKKPKELPVTTAVLKIPLHCQGCVRKIHKIVSKTTGYMEMSIDKNKDLVTVKGAIDGKLLAEALQHKLKKAVEIVPPKKESGGGEKKGKGGGGGEKKGKGADGNDGDGNDGGGGGGGEKKAKGSGSKNDGERNDGGGGKAEALKMENYGGPIGYPYPQYAYGSGYVDYVHAPQLFSDENPNACVLM